MRTRAKRRDFARNSEDKRQDKTIRNMISEIDVTKQVLTRNRDGSFLNRPSPNSTYLQLLRQTRSLFEYGQSLRGAQEHGRTPQEQSFVEEKQLYSGKIAT